MEFKIKFPVFHKKKKNLIKNLEYFPFLNKCSFISFDDFFHSSEQFS